MRVGSRVVILLSVAAFVGWWATYESSQTLVSPTSPPSIQKESIPKTEPQHREGADTPIAANRAERVPAPEPQLAMAEKLQTASSLRQFVLDAWNSSGVGGRYYAVRVMEMCRTLTATAPSQASPAEANNPAYQRALSEAARLSSQCGQFSDLDYSTYSRRTASVDSRIDPILDLAERRYGVGAAPGRRDEFIRPVIQTRDPYLIDEMLPGLLIGPAVDGPGLAYYFDGMVYPRSTMGYFEGALPLVACRLGLPCDRDPKLIADCTNAQPCFGSRAEAARGAFAQGDDAKFAEIQRLANAMASAIEAGQWERFVRPRAGAQVLSR